MAISSLYMLAILLATISSCCHSKTQMFMSCGCIDRKVEFVCINREREREKACMGWIEREGEREQTSGNLRGGNFLQGN